MAQTLDLGKEDIFSLILKMSWPSIISMTAMSLYNFIDTFWLARYSAQALAALTVCFPVQIMGAAIGAGTGIGAGSYAARMLGGGKPSLAVKTAGQTFFLSAFLGMSSILVVLVFGDSLIRLFGASDEIFSLCHDYLYLSVYSAPLFFFSLIAAILLRVEGKPILAMDIILIALVSSAILDPLLIFGIGPFPRLGIKGAALSGITAHAIMFIFSMFFLQRKSSHFAFSVKEIFPKIKLIQSIYSTGLPSIMINLIISITLIVYNHVLAGFGYQAIAAFGICFRINSLATMVIFGIGTGLMPVVGFNLGARLFARLEEAVAVSLKISIAFAMISVTILELFAPQIVRLFARDPNLITLTILALRIHVVALLLAAPIIIYANMFMGLGKGLTALVILLIRDIMILIPALIFLPLFLKLTGVWLALPFSHGIELFIVVYWANRELRNLGKD